MALALEFDYFKPATLNEALELKSRYGSKARFLAGGTDLINNMNCELLTPEAIIDLKGVDELRKLDYSPSRRELWIGALVTFSQMMDSPLIKERFPLFGETSAEVASIPIRNRASMVGNLCSCVPCMDSAPALAIYEARAVIVKGDSKTRRSVPIMEFATGPRRTVLEHDEMLLGLVVPEPESDRLGTCYVKLKRYEGEDLSQAGVAVMALEKGHQYRISFGSVGPRPIRAGRIEALLNGNKLTPELVEQAKGLVPQEITPISDIRASREYRMHMCQVMLGRALAAAVERMEGKGPGYGCKLI